MSFVTLTICRQLFASVHVAHGRITDLKLLVHNVFRVRFYLEDHGDESAFCAMRWSVFIT